MTEAMARNEKAARILICEDEVILAKDLADSLKDLGYEVAGKASSGEDCIRLAEETRPDLILMDIDLKGEIDGIEAAEQIRARMDIPVVYVTVYAEKDLLEKATHTGPYGYLSKPVGFLELKSTVEMALFKHKADRQLRASEVKFRSLVEQIPAIVYEAACDQSSTKVYVSPHVESLLGFSQEDFVADPDLWGKMLHTDDRARVMADLSKRRESGETFVSEYRMIARDDRTIWFRDEARVVCDGIGQPPCVQGVMFDITDLKKSEEALTESEERFSKSFVNNPAGLTIVHMDTNRVLEVNDAWTKIFGYSREEAIGRTTMELGIYDAETYRKIMEEIRVKGQVRNVEVTVKNRTGEDRVLLVSREVIPMGDVPHLLAMGVDITDRKKAEEALTASEEKFRQLAEVAFEGILFHDGGVLLDANEQFYTTMGYEPDELIGTQIMEKSIAPESIDTVRGHIASGFTEPYEIVGLRKDGSRIPLEVRARLKRIGGKDIRAVALRDLSQRKEMERRLVEAQKMEAVGTLAGGISHDFNNLLQIISGNAELLEIELAQRDLRFTEMDAIRQAAHRGADLVKQILTFSRRVDMKFEIINLNDDVKNTERLLYRTIPKMIGIELMLEDRLHPVRADSTQIEQILINLAVNAKDAMPDGGTLAIKTQNLNVKNQYCKGCGGHFTGQYVLLTVSDTGHGMDEDVLQHIFEPFFTTKGLAEGTGLGLATVFGIVKMHGGHIGCESEVGKGTTFAIYFPAAETHKPDIESIHEATAVAGGTETILVVDDEPMIAELAARMLENAGYSVITASTGREALDIYAQHNSDVALVILDLIMPEMGGEQCLKELLKINPQVKAVISSGFAITGDTKDFLDEEAKGKVAKPFNMRELLRAVRHVLDGT